MDPLILLAAASEEGLAETVRRLLAESPWLAPGAVFLGGVLTALNPCVLATLPLVVAFVGGRRDATSAGRGIALTLAFVGGLSASFAALGVAAALTGRLLGDAGRFWDYAILVVCLAMGVHLTGLLEVPLPNWTVTPRWRGLPGAAALGALFGAVSTPCATPILVVVMAYVASSGASLAWGAFLLFVYALGHSLLLFAVGASAGAARTLLESPRLALAGRRLRQGAGILIAAVGVWVFLSRS
ncbi:MAG: sulfite exporter TauE/SafE family protein [Planctomycetaceae bacterium]|nr:cytochrome c biogenesis protein CcdA [Planctomycetota bacterium]NUN51344.1 sulfite exporter TauE/SafE family protein [Planctomycetaceae bacterium]